ncbi:MAG: Clp protease ClpC, partial [Candidatus Marinimicrobia bacterium]|nr:Clp protease ClpC [Candidatus Neomarinimicrobiota bacterium]
DRRLQKITINPASISESIDILNGLKEKYQEHHKVIYTNDAIENCVYLSERYISDKYLPDKAIDVMDEAGARAHMYNLEVPKDILNAEDELQKTREKKELKVSEQLFEEAAVLRDKEKKLFTKLSKAQQKWEKMEGDNFVELTEDHIADVVSIMTGVPVSKVAETESEKLLSLSNELSKHIIGQDDAISSLSKAIRRSRVGLKDPKKPIGVFLFLGPTGVGKTELAKVLAKYLFTHNKALIKVDMTEFAERFSISRLIGAPPGYVGYEEGGELTEKVRRNPYSVVLLDEVEKAHPDIFNILLQLFDEGILTDGLGRKVDFRNTIIIMTSNIGSGSLKQFEFGFDAEKDSVERFSSMKAILFDEVKKMFTPELLNRIDETIVFHALDEKNVFEIIDLQLLDLYQNLDKLGLRLKITNSAKKLIVKKGFSSEYGVRNLRREIRTSLEDPISEILLKQVLKKGTLINVNSLKNQLIFDLKQKLVSKRKTTRSTP